MLIFDKDHGLRCYEQQLTKLMVEIAAMMMVIRRMVVLLLLHKRLGVTKKNSFPKKGKKFGEEEKELTAAAR